MRYAKKKRQKKPTWTIVVMLLGLVLVILVALLLFQDYRRAVAEGERHIVVTSASSDRQVQPSLLSPDTIKRKLQARGFKVDYLATVADQRNLAYDVAETHVDGTPALILVFKDHATALRWIKRSTNPAVYKMTWAISVPDQDLASRIAQKMEADLRG